MAATKRPGEQAIETILGKSSAPCPNSTATAGGVKQKIKRAYEFFFWWFREAQPKFHFLRGGEGTST